MIINRYMARYALEDARTAADKTFGYEASKVLNPGVFVHNQEVDLAENSDFLRKLINHTSGSPNQKAFSVAYTKQREYRLWLIKDELKDGALNYTIAQVKAKSGDWWFERLAYAFLIIVIVVGLVYKH